MTSAPIIDGRFELGEQIGAGAVGTVYRAIDVRTGERVALKKLRGQAADFARFAREAQALARLQHPNVVRYIAHGLDDMGVPYLVTEWLEGEDLRARLARGPLGAADTIVLGRLAARALAAVHECGLLHRDIKPGNLFLADGRVDRLVLLDFGLARGSTDGLSLTRTGVVIGTPGFMAPEQVRGERDIDHRADLFSLGCVLYKCLSGTGPFAGGNIVAVMTKVLVHEPKSLETSAPGAPPPLRDLVHRLLAKDPFQRPASAAEVLASLDVLSSEGLSEPQAPSSMRGGLTGHERRVVSVLLVGPVADSGSSLVLPGALESERGKSSRQEGQLLGLFLVEQRGHMDRLPDGTRVITPAQPGTPVDQARWAARCALALRRILPSAPMALVFGQRETTGAATMGDAIERAAAMLEQARSGTATLAGAERPAWIAVDEAAAALLDARFDVRRDGGLLHLTGVRDVALAGRTVLGKATPTVGREWEMTTIRDLFHECVSGPAAAGLLITAAAGLGKSRLAGELLPALAADCPQAVIWFARGDPLRAGSALYVVRQALQHAVGIDPDDTSETRRHRLLDRAASELPFDVAEHAAVILGEMASAPFPDDGRPGLRAARTDPLLMGDEMRWAWEQLVAAECAVHPVVLVVDDAQWADLPSLRLIEAALKNGPASPFLVVLLGRPEVREIVPSLLKDGRFHEIRLKPLSMKASVSLAEHVLGEHASVDLVRSLASRAGGNAFFLEELIRASAERGDVAVPDSVLATVQSRLLALEPEHRRLLRAGAVFGDVFWAGGAAELMGFSGAASIEEHVIVLVAKEILVRREPSRFPFESEIGFRHSLLREGALALLTDEDRALGHRLAGDWLSRAGEGDAAVLAEHFERGGEPGRAAVFHLRAAQQALFGLDLDAAAARARKAADGAPEAKTRLAALTLCCEINVWRFDWPSVERDVAALLSEAVPGSAGWAQAHTTRMSAAMAFSRPSEIMDSLLALMSVEPTPEGVSRYVHGLCVGVFVLGITGHLGGSAPVLARVDALYGRLPEDGVVARGWHGLAHTFVHLWQHGDPWTALQHVERASESLAEAGDRRMAAFAGIYRAECLHRLGVFDGPGDDLASISGLDPRSMLAVIRSFYEGLLAVDTGAFERAERAAAQRIEGAREGDPMGPARIAEGHFIRAEVARKQGRFADAEAEIAPFLGALQRPPLYWPVAAAALALCRVRLGRAAEALAVAEEAMSRLEASGSEGMRGSLVRLALAESLDAAGQPDRARAVLAAAHARLMSVAERIPAGPVRAGFLERVAENGRIVELGRAWLGLRERP